MGLAGLVLLLALAAPRAAHAQRVDGQLLDAETSAPIEGATLRLLDAQGQLVTTAQSGQRGLFTLRAPQPGLYRIQASRMGYREDATGTVDLTAAQEITNMGIVKAGTLQGIGLLHGTAAGHKLLVHLPACQLLNPTKDTINGKRVISYDIKAVPVSGNDEWRIVTL